ncbi:exosortase N [Pontibacter rugosus]|uniref:Exosortase N n=1 Tax=Pontibacter rugosus TaxID=1745966 RepID=A0ABW3SMF2_9BACT
MIATNFRTQNKERLFLTLGLIGFYTGIGGFFLKDYLLWDAQWLLALVLVPLVAQPKREKPIAGWQLLLATSLAVAAALLQVSTLYFFAFLLAFWCGANLIFGSISLYPLLLLTVASPIFKYIANIISFPLRLQLTEWAVAALTYTGNTAEAAGNLILVKGEEFSVDPACAGLSMLSLSLIIAVFILAHLQKSKQGNWPLWAVVTMLLAMLALNLFANLLRILLLVWFKVLPGNPMHDVMGLLCLTFYAIMPFYLLAQLCFKYTGPTQTKKRFRSSVSLRGMLLLNYLLLLMLVICGLGVQQAGLTTPADATAAPTLAGFNQESMENGVIKYSNAHALVYLKPVQAFYSTEHHPLICWEGSGYKFRNVQTLQLKSDTVYVGELQKGKDKLYTAWWMDNGKHRTIEQQDWRWRMLKGEPPFRLVNLTVAHKAELAPSILTLLQKQEQDRIALNTL